MDTERVWRTLLAGLAAGVMLTAPASAGDAAGVSTPAWPASLSDCVDCSDTLDATHELTFISRFAFPLGNARLSREASRELLRMLAELESFAVVKHVEIIGHADPSGPENFNRWISEKRAERVRDHFAQHGVDPRVMTIRGAGSSEPLSGAIDPSEHRRTEVRVTLQAFRK